MFEGWGLCSKSPRCPGSSHFVTVFNVRLYGYQGKAKERISHVRDVLGCRPKSGIHHFCPYSTGQSWHRRRIKWFLNT